MNIAPPQPQKPSGESTAVMSAIPLAAVDLPLKVLAWADGNHTNVTYTSPDELARRYGLTADLTAKLAGIAALTDALVSLG